MTHFAGLDVSIEETAVCVVDDQGAVLLQCSVASQNWCQNSKAVCRYPPANSWAVALTFGASG